MDERQITKLLSLIIASLLESKQERGSDKLAEEIAEASWDGLVLLLRESMLQQGEMSLEGFGHFRQVGEDWLFRPAVAIAEMEALRLQPEEGYRLLAERAVSLLTDGLHVLATIPEDVQYAKDAKERTIPPQEALLGRIFGNALPVKGEWLSERLASLIELLVYQERSLRDNSLRSRVSRVPKVGSNYTGVVRRVKPYGAFVEILPGVEGLVHISELAPYRVREVVDVVKSGDEVKVKIINIDDDGRIRLSRKAVIMETPGYESTEYAEPSQLEVDDVERLDR
jgi:predicted RNA-binding protein with RPS1 domain